jgi:adenylyltransferase/sulfurtransferase
MTQMRYSRHTTLDGLGEPGQASLAKSRFLIFGVGGLGSPAALYLARSGAGEIVVCDPDTVDATNLPRQLLFNDEDIGERKAVVAARRLMNESPQLRVTALAGRPEEAEITRHIESCDVVLDCTDNLPSRWTINKACRAARKPLVTGAAIRYEGQVAVFRHDQPESACYECLYSDADEELADCAGQGILASVAGTVGTVMVTEAIRIVAGFGSGLADRLWAYDGGSGESHTLRIERRIDCPVCQDIG